MAKAVKISYEACPKCHFVNPEYGDMNVDSDNVWQTAVCPICGFSWNNVYRFEACEDVNTCEPLDENGNVATE